MLRRARCTRANPVGFRSALSRAAVAAVGVAVVALLGAFAPPVPANDGARARLTGSRAGVAVFEFGNGRCSRPRRRRCRRRTSRCRSRGCPRNERAECNARPVSGRRSSDPASGSRSCSRRRRPSLPSSQTSPGSFAPSPHAMVMRQGRPGLGHSQYGSTVQTPEQPSPGRLLPSSQSSLCWLSSPSPHAGPDGPISKHSGGGSATSQGSGSSPSNK